MARALCSIGQACPDEVAHAGRSSDTCFEFEFVKMSTGQLRPGYFSTYRSRTEWCS